MIRDPNPSRWSGLALSIVLLATGCPDEDGAVESRRSMAERMADVLPVAAPVDAPLPADRDAILRELSPLPYDTLLVVYEVEGPGGLRGNLEVLARPGGLRRENWTLTVPLGSEGERRLDGSTIQTPDGVWVEGDPPHAFTPSPLGALADAYLALDEAERRAVIEPLRRLRSTLARAREGEAANEERILDIPCHVTRVATTELCLWEATGLPLRYDSAGLRLRALNIDTSVDIGARAFEVPFEPAPVPGFDAARALERVARGELGELVPLLHPGLRLPTV